ncbi:MAG: hypothetical protein E7812_07875 [Phenylobacterium sp.]|nr:MAG: hypothetical protein E7812_07875 [Phenylobacterium sp.]
MSLKLGGSTNSSSSNSTSNTNTNSNTVQNSLTNSNTNTNSLSNTGNVSAYNSTTTPTAPAWASDLTQNIAGQVGNLTQLNPQSLVAAAQPLQWQAAAGATNLSGDPWNFDTAANITRQAADTSWTQPYLNASAPSASGGQASQWVGNYMDPYLQQVVGATSADLDASDGRVRAQQALDLAGSGAFGGSGAALTQSMTEGELARARATSIGQLESQGYQSAVNAAAGDADRATQAQVANAQMQLQSQQQKAQLQLQAQQQQLQAANGLVGLSTAYDANQRADIGTQQQVGDDLRNINQQQLQAPVTSTQQIVAMLSGLPIQLFTGQQQSGTQVGGSSTSGSTDSSTNSATSGTSNTVASGTTNSSGSGTNTEVHAGLDVPLHNPFGP